MILKGNVIMNLRPTFLKGLPQCLMLILLSLLLLDCCLLYSHLYMQDKVVTMREEVWIGRNRANEGEE